MVEIWNVVKDFFINMSSFWNWLLTPIQELGGWKPISIIGVTGLGVILAFWIAKLIIFWA